MSMKTGISLGKKSWWLKTENTYRNIILNNIKKSKMYSFFVICFYVLNKLISKTLP